MSENLEMLVTELRNAIHTGLPGEAAQFLMVPGNRPDPDPFKPSDYRSSAVCIVLCEDEHGHIFIPLILRKEYEGYHSGQISLPGGKFDAEDGELMNTAIRECREEIGLQEITIIGELSPL